MNQSKFKTMNRQDLHAYVLAHREDQDAFYTYVDRLHAEATWIEMPALQNEEDLDNYPEFLAHVRKSGDRRE